METSTPGFLDLPGEACDFHHARYALLPLPYDATCSWGAGTRAGPGALLEASRQVEWYDEELDQETWRAGIATLRPVEPVVSAPEHYLASVRSTAMAVVEAGRFPVGLGGEHSVTAALVAAAAVRHPGLAVLQVDAHLDLRESYQGSPHSHACVARRLHEAGHPLVQVGVRSGTASEWRFARRHAAGLFPAREIADAHPDSWVPRVIDALPPGPVYVTVDLDGFDPAVIPGTGTPEPGGLRWYPVLALLKAVARCRQVVGLDVVELDPRPGCRVSEFAAARLVYRVLGYVEHARRSKKGATAPA